MNWQGSRASTAALALAVLLLAMLIFAGYGWKEERDARQRANSQTSQQEKAIKELESQRERMQSALDEQIEALERQKKQRVSAPQFVAEASRLIPDLPKPLEVREVKAEPNLPDSPVVQEVVVPKEDLRAIRDAGIDCEEKSLQYAACTSEQAMLNEQLKVTKEQRDEWKTAAKGGSRWHRTLAAAKWFAVGAGAGYAGYAFAHR